jgi:polysaccharide biosynthesis protein VpsQ
MAFNRPGIIRCNGQCMISVVYGVVFLTIMILAYANKLPIQLQYIPYHDKIAHLVLYSFAAYLGHRVLKYRSFQFLTLTLPLFPVLFGIFTAIEEGLQSLSPYRTLDSLDLVASWVGVWLGYWFAERGQPRSTAGSVLEPTDPLQIPNESR